MNSAPQPQGDRLSPADQGMNPENKSRRGLAVGVLVGTAILADVVLKTNVIGALAESLFADLNDGR